MKTIQITISGPTASGKTTVFYLIKDFLKTMGFDVDLTISTDYDSEEQLDLNIRKDLMCRLDVLKKKCKIQIQEQQTCQEEL